MNEANPPQLLDTHRLLKTLPLEPRPVADIAADLGVPAQVVMSKLKPLIDEGLVELQNPGPADTCRLRSTRELLAVPAPEPGERKVFVEMTERAATLVQSALEFYARIGLGQFNELLELARMGLLKGRGGADISVEQMEQAQVHLDQFKRVLLGFEPNASLGVHSDHLNPCFSEAWTMCKGIRHRMAWDRTPEGSAGVYHDEPLRDENVPGFRVHSGPPVEPTVDASELPAGMLLQHKDGRYRVIGPSADGQAFELFAESRSSQTAIQMAKNRAEGRPPRSHRL